MATIAELGRRVKIKHPEYIDIDDTDLGRRIKTKYPGQYDDFTDTPSMGFPEARQAAAKIGMEPPAVPWSPPTPERIPSFGEEYGQAQKRIAEAERQGAELVGRKLIVEPVVQGISEIGGGARQAWQGPGMERRAGGASRMFRGAMQAAAPVALPALAATAPIPLALGLAGGMTSQYAVESGAEALGIPEGYARLAGDVAGLAGGVGASRLRLPNMGRRPSLATPEPPPAEVVPEPPPPPQSVNPVPELPTPPLPPRVLQDTPNPWFRRPVTPEPPASPETPLASYRAPALVEPAPPPTAALPEPPFPEVIPEPPSPPRPSAIQIAEQKVAALGLIPKPKTGAISPPAEPPRIPVTAEEVARAQSAATATPPPPPLAAGDPILVNPKHFNIAAGTKQKVTTIVEAIRPELEQSRGKPLTHAEVIEMADKVGLLGQTTSREASLRREAELLNLRRHAAAMAEQEKVTPEFLESLRRISDEGAAMGRGVESFKIEADPRLRSAKVALLTQLTKLNADEQAILAAANNITDWNDPSQVIPVYRQFVKPKIGEILDEYRYINMLSSPQTHIVNAFSNMTQALAVAPATRLVSGGIDSVASVLTGRQREVYAREVSPYYRGLFNAIGNSAREATRVLQGKAWAKRPDVYSEEFARIPTGSKLLEPAQVIPRALEAMDVFWRGLLKGGEMEALAYRASRKGQALNIQEAAAAADEVARYYTFRKALDSSNKTGQGHLLSAVDTVTRAIYRVREGANPIVGQITKWTLPFIMTPMNILKQGIEYSPAGFLTLPGAAQPAEQAAKAMIGSTIFAGAAWLAQVGDATWNVPKNEKERTLFYSAGRQPFSLRIGDTWVSYSRLGPPAYPIALAAAMKHMSQDQPHALTDDFLEKLMKTLAGQAEFFSSQSYVESLGRLLDAIQGHPEGATRILAGLPQQVIPLASLQRWVARIIDPIARKAEGIKEQLQRGTPGWSKDLPAHLDLRGEPQRRPSPYINAVSPIAVSPVLPEEEEIFQRRRAVQQQEIAARQRRVERKKERMRNP